MKVAEDHENNLSYAQNIVVDEVCQDADIEYIHGRNIEGDDYGDYEMPVATTVRDSDMTEIKRVESFKVEDNLLIVDAEVIYNFSCDLYTFDVSKNLILYIFYRLLFHGISRGGSTLFFSQLCLSLSLIFLIVNTNLILEITIESTIY